MTAINLSPMSGKRVLFLINQDLGGGVEYLAQVIGHDLVRRGALCSTRFIYPKNGYSSASKIGFILRSATRLLTWAPDVVITFQPTASAIAASAGRIGGCKIRIVHQSNSPVKSHPIVRTADRVLGSIGAYSVIIANSRATKSEFAAYPEAYRNKIRLIEHGIPPPVHLLPPTKIREKFGIPPDRPMLLMAARLDLQKGQHVIVSALPKLRGARLVMAGSGPEKDNLIALAQRDGSVDRLHFLGHVGRQDLTDLYRAATLMVFPSSWETFGLAAVEAAMVGLPVVASDIPALREVLTCEGRTPAHFVSTRDPVQWAKTIKNCLADDHLRPACEAFAPIIQEQYSERRMIEEYVTLYSELIS